MHASTHLRHLYMQWKLHSFYQLHQTKLKTTTKKMVKLRSLRFCMSNTKVVVVGGGGGGGGQGVVSRGDDIEWEMRPGGMLVQKRDCGKSDRMIKVRVSLGSQLHDISIGATSTFGDLKMVLSLVTGLEPKEQRVLFRGKEREDRDHLHMIGVQDSDKMLLLEDPATKERKLRSMMTSRTQVIMGGPCHQTIMV